MRQCTQNEECKSTVYGEGSCFLFYQTLSNRASSKIGKSGNKDLVYAEKKSVSNVCNWLSFFSDMICLRKN